MKTHREKTLSNVKDKELMNYLYTHLDRATDRNSGALNNLLTSTFPISEEEKQEITGMAKIFAPISESVIRDIEKAKKSDEMGKYNPFFISSQERINYINKQSGLKKRRLLYGQWPYELVDAKPANRDASVGVDPASESGDYYCW